MVCTKCIPTKKQHNLQDVPSTTKVFGTLLQQNNEQNHIPESSCILKVRGVSALPSNATLSYAACIYRLT